MNLVIKALNVETTLQTFEVHNYYAFFPNKSLNNSSC